MGQRLNSLRVGLRDKLSRDKVSTLFGLVDLETFGDNMKLKSFFISNFNRRNMQIWCAFGGAGVIANAIDTYVSNEHGLWLIVVAQLLNITVWTLLLSHGLSRFSNEND